MQAFGLYFRYEGIRKENENEKQKTRRRRKKDEMKFEPNSFPLVKASKDPSTMFQVLFSDKFVAVALKRKINLIMFRWPMIKRFRIRYPVALLKTPGPSAVKFFMLGYPHKPDLRILLS